MSVLLISGAAAGVSAIFKAPFTGIMFALEIPYQRDISRDAFIPATLASISAYLTATTFMGGESIFPLLPTEIPGGFTLIHAFIIGMLAAVVATIFVSINEYLHQVKTHVHVDKYLIAIAGGLIVGVIGYIMPEVAGTGYHTISHLLSAGVHIPMNQIFMLLVLKILITSVTLNSGGSGGVFIPTLFVGAALGTLYTNLIPNSGGVFIIVAAMGAMIAAANKTLLTSVALVAETAGPASVVYTLVAAATSYFVSGNISFYGHVQPEEEMLEEEEAIHVIHHILRKSKKSQQLEKIKVNELMQHELDTLERKMTIQQALEKICDCMYSVYPVVLEGRLLGSLTLEDLLTSSLDDEIETLSELKLSEPLTVQEDTSLKDLIPLLEEGEVDCVYVVNNEKDRMLQGMISETDIRLILLKTLNKENIKSIINQHQS